MHNGCTPTDVGEVQHANKCEKETEVMEEGQQVENSGQR